MVNAVVAAGVVDVVETTGVVGAADTVVAAGGVDVVETAGVVGAEYVVETSSGVEVADVVVSADMFDSIWASKVDS